MDTRAEDDQRRFVRHAAQRRVLTLALLAPSVVVGLATADAPAMVWALALVHLVAWPWAAWRRSAQHAEPGRMETRNRRVDALMGGAWAGLVQLTPVAAAALATVVLAEAVAADGRRGATVALALFALGAGTLWALGGAPMPPMPTPGALWAALPLLLAYPATLAARAHRLAAESADRQTTLEALGRHDALTGLANPRAFFEAAGHELRRFRRSGHRASLMVVDIDRFRLLNEEHGRGTGDAVLLAVAEVLRRTLRDTDTCARLHADRFGIVLADAFGGGVADLAERLRHAVAARVPATVPGTTPTVSIGLAPIDAGMADGAAWWAAAEAALAAAKEAGRNRSRSAPAFGPRER